MNATTLRHLSADELLRIAQPCTDLEQVLLDKLGRDEPAVDHDSRSIQELLDEISDLEDEVSSLHYDLSVAGQGEDDSKAQRWIDDVRETILAIVKPVTPQALEDAIAELEHQVQLKGIPF